MEPQDDLRLVLLSSKQNAGRNHKLKLCCLISNTNIYKKEKSIFIVITIFEDSSTQLICSL